MARVVGMGIQNFEKIIRNHCFYIDKTGFIKEWWENQDDVTLIARPRRFGKTLTMSMVEQFFSLKYADRADLFEGLAVWKDEKFRQMQGTYPVLSLSFADVKESGFSQVREKICWILKNLCDEYEFLFQGDFLREGEADFFRRVSPEMNDATASYVLKTLSACLTRYYGKKVIILLDEYDTPLQEAYVGGYWKELAAFTRSMFNAAFKSNPYLERAIMTGITRVSKESIFSDLNNLEVVTTTSEKYEDSFGFTQEEVWNALEEYGLSGKKEEVKRWYDGFTFGSHRDIYNPWSVLNYLKKGKLSAYWANTSSNSLAGKLIREGSKGVKQDFEQLMRGDTIQMEIDEEIVYDQLLGNRSAVWSLLLASGYIKVIEREYRDETGRWYYTLALTNREVCLMFETLVRSWFTGQEDSYHGFIRAFLEDDLDAMNEYMNQVALASFSYFDVGRGTEEGGEPERFYHGFVLGLLVDLRGRYILTSNRESGFGRYDVMLEPVNERDHAMIIEFKVFRPDRESTLEETVQAAHKQIEEKQYAAILEAKGIGRSRIRKYGFAFAGKRVLIG